MGNGASNDEPITAGCHGVGGAQHAFLIAKGAACRANAGRDNPEISAESLPQGGSFEWAANQSAQSGGFGQCSQPQHLLFDALIQSDRAALLRVHAGEQSHPEQQKLRALGGAGGFPQHGRATEGVQGGHGNPECQDGFHRMGDRLRDVVEFQIQKDPQIPVSGHFDNAGPFSCEELKTDFDPLQTAIEPVQQRVSRPAIRHIQCHNDAFPRLDGTAQRTFLKSDCPSGASPDVVAGLGIPLRSILV